MFLSPVAVYYKESRDMPCASILIPLSPAGKHNSQQSHKVHKSVLQSCVSKTELLRRHRGQKRRLHSSLTPMYPRQSGGFSGCCFYKTHEAASSLRGGLGAQLLSLVRAREEGGWEKGGMVVSTLGRTPHHEFRHTLSISTIQNWSCTV